MAGNRKTKKTVAGKKKMKKMMLRTYAPASGSTVPFSSLNDPKCNLKPISMVVQTVTQGTPDCQVTKRIFVGQMVELPKSMHADALKNAK